MVGRGSLSIVMSIGCIITILYFVIGTSLAFMWWNDGYRAKYEYAKECGKAEDAMVTLLLMLFIFFWPLKLVKNCFGNE